MKRLISIILGSLTLLPAMAQLESGYYRIQNVNSKRYISIANNKMDDQSIADLKSTGNIGSSEKARIYALRTITEEEAIHTPSTILYVEIQAISDNSVRTSYKVNVKGQDMSTERLLKEHNTTLALIKYKNDNSYLLSGSHPSYGSASLNDTYFSFDKCGFAIVSMGTSDKWDVKPINNKDQYLGIKPDVSINGKYYGTLYTSFPYKVASDMKAYYVKHYWVGSDITNQMAEMVEIENGIVPASTPVILECSSADPANNKIEPLKASEVKTSITGNLLQGVFFSFIKWGANNNENESEKLGLQLKNVTSYDSESMRMIGTTQDGKLGLVKASDSQLIVSNQGKYIPESKVYLSVPTSANGDIKLVDSATYAAGIDDIISDPEKTTRKGVYTLHGVQISNSSETDGLPSGIYIVNGKKTIVK